MGKSHNQRNVLHMGAYRFCFAVSLLSVLLFSSSSWSQVPAPKAAPVQPQTETAKDALGRDTPRGTVIGFITAARKGNTEVAAQYLNTSLRGKPAEELAGQLAFVLDRRLPARLNELSDKPEGSVPDPLKPNEDSVGTITTTQGDLDILLERVDRGKQGKIWLFSKKTLTSIPSVFDEVSALSVNTILPEFLVNTRVISVPLFEWLAFLVAMPLFYLLTGLLNTLISGGIGELRRRVRRNTTLLNPQVLPPPIRLLILAGTIRWVLSKIDLPLLARQFWSTTAVVITIAACVWLLILLDGLVEHHVVKRLQSRALNGSASIVRLGRRVIDVLIVFAGLLFALHYFGVNLEAALAGLGVGGIAVAFAAQKTLENVIGGISLILDQALRVGDTLKLGDIVGTVDDIGLRSTRIRTFDRTLVSVPNGQIANMSVEAMSARDKFWFHPLVSLRYDTTPAQMQSIISKFRNLLTEYSSCDPASVQVRLLRFGASSFDIDIFAYVSAPNWHQFLQLQQELLLSMLNIIHEAGAQIALPSQRTYVASDSTEELMRLKADSAPKSDSAAKIARPKSRKHKEV